METVTWGGYDWYTRPLWGQHHPAEKHTWYDPDCIKLQDDGSIVLDIHYNPRTFIDNDGNKVTKDFGVVQMRTIREFTYGTFEWEMKTMEGKYVWPALWLASNYSWPPEIDCMEGWSNENANFTKRLFWVNIKPTMHWSENCDPKNGEHKSDNRKNICRCRIKQNDFNKYKVVWAPDYVDVYYNDYKVKRFTNKEMLAHFNKPEVHMHVLMSSGFYSDFPKHYKDYVNRNKPMIVKSFKYTPLK